MHRKLSLTNPPIHTGWGLGTVRGQVTKITFYWGLYKKSKLQQKTQLSKLPSLQESQFNKQCFAGKWMTCPNLKNNLIFANPQYGVWYGGQLTKHICARNCMKCLNIHKHPSLLIHPLSQGRGVHMSTNLLKCIHWKLYEMSRSKEKKSSLPTFHPVRVWELIH